VVVGDVGAGRIRGHGRGRMDLVVAGEVIEHLDNPSALLTNVRPAPAREGRLVLITPNPYCLRLVMASLRGRVVESVDHIAYFFPSAIAELAYRAGYRLDRWCGARHNFGGSPPLRRRLADVAARWLFCPEAACWTII
jgi:Methyltransferase domain